MKTIYRNERIIMILQKMKFRYVGCHLFQFWLGIHPLNPLYLIMSILLFYLFHSSYIRQFPVISFSHERITYPKCRVEY